MAFLPYSMSIYRGPTARGMALVYLKPQRLIVEYCLSRLNVEEDGLRFLWPQRLIDELLHCQYRTIVSKNGLSFLLATASSRRPSTLIGSYLPICSLNGYEKLGSTRQLSLLLCQIYKRTLCWVRRNTASHKGRVFAVGAKQHHININVGYYGNVRAKRHGLEHKKGICCRGKSRRT